MIVFDKYMPRSHHSRTKNRFPEFVRFSLIRNVRHNYRFQAGPVVALILLASAFSAVAQSPMAVAAYPFSDSPASSVMTGSTLASAIGIGPGASPWIYSNVAAQGKSALLSNAGFNASTETAAVNADDYIAFTVTPTNGSIGITEIRFSSLRTPGNGSAAPDNFVIRTSLDNFSTPVAGGTLALNAADNTFQRHTNDLATTPALRHLTGPIEFRIYFWASQGIGTSPSNRIFRIDEVVVMADVWPGASESFSSGNTDADYSSETALADPLNRSVTTGNRGFATDLPWESGAGRIQVVAENLSHPLLTGATASGAVRIRPAANQAEAATRAMAVAPPGGSQLLLSGLVQIDSEAALNPGDHVAAGAGVGGNANDWNIDSGIHLGAFRDGSGGVFLAAFAGGIVYPIGGPLTAAELGHAHLIVVGIDLNPAGPDRLHAWVARAGDSLLSPAFGPNGLAIETWADPADADTLRIQSAGGSHSGGPGGGVVIDEIRLDSTLGRTTSGRQGPLEIVVDPASGNDQNSATAHAPLRSLAAAQAAARAHAPNMGGDITVNLASGEYRLDAPLVFGPEDSGTNGHRIIYRSRDGIGTARLRGSEVLTGWTPHTGTIWKIPVEPGLVFHTLYESGRRATKARTPNYVYDPDFPSARAPYFTSENGSGPDNTNSTSWLTWRTGDINPASLSVIGNLRINIFDRGYRDWHRLIFAVTTMDPAARRLTFDNLGDPQEIGENARYFLEDHASFLDAAGEFYLDTHAGMLYYIPRGGTHPDLLQIAVPRTHDLIRLQGTTSKPAAYITFSGLDLGETDGFSPIGPWWTLGWGMTDRALIWMNLTESITIRNCRLANSGRHGVLMAGGNLNNRVEGCLVENMGVTGLKISNRRGNGPGQGTAYPSRGHVLTNNRVRNVGQLALYASCIGIHCASDNEVSYSDLRDSPRYAITMRGNTSGEQQDLFLIGFPAAEGNHFHHLLISGMCHDGGDAGALHAAGVNLADGPHVNTFEQIIIDAVEAVPGMQDIAPDAIFLDWPERTMGQVFRNISATNIQGEPMRGNRGENVTSAIRENLSWLPGFNPALIETGTIGVTADFPLEFSDDRHLPVVLADSGSVTLPNNVVALAAGTIVPPELTFTASPDYAWSVVPVRSVAAYSFEDSAVSTVNNPAASEFATGSGVSAFSYSLVGISGKSAIFSNAGFNQVTAAGAVNFNDYVAFTVDLGGDPVTLAAIEFHTLRRPVEGSAAPDSFAVRTSHDGFATDVATGALTINETNDVFECHTASLIPNTGLRGLTGTLEVRIYFWASQGVGNTPANRTLRLDDVRLAVLGGGGTGTFANFTGTQNRLTLQQPGTYLVTVTANLENWSGSQSAMLDFATQPPSEPTQSFVEWASESALPPGQSGYGDTPLAAGIPNLVAYATGWRPNPGARDPITLEFSDGAAEIAIPWRTEIEVGTFFLIESSTDLREWKVDGEFDWDSVPLGDGRIEFRGRSLRPLGTHQFFRLRVWPAQ